MSPDAVGMVALLFTSERPVACSFKFAVSLSKGREWLQAVADGGLLGIDCGSGVMLLRCPTEDLRQVLAGRIQWEDAPEQAQCRRRHVLSGKQHICCVDPSIFTGSNPIRLALCGNSTKVPAPICSGAPTPTRTPTPAPAPPGADNTVLYVGLAGILAVTLMGLLVRRPSAGSRPRRRSRSAMSWDGQVEGPDSDVDLD